MPTRTSIPPTRESIVPREQSAWPTAALRSARPRQSGWSLMARTPSPPPPLKCVAQRNSLNTTASMKVNHGLASCLASPATGHAHHRFGQVNDLQAHFAEPIPGTDQVVQARCRLAAVRDRNLGVVAHARTLIRVSSGAYRTAAIGPRSAGSVLLSESKGQRARSFPNRRWARTRCSNRAARCLAL